MSESSPPPSTSKKQTVKLDKTAGNFYLLLHLGKHGVINLDPPSQKFNKSKYRRLVEALEYLKSIDKGVRMEDVSKVTDEQLISAADHFKYTRHMERGMDGKLIRYVIPHKARSQRSNRSTQLLK